MWMNDIKPWYLVAIFNVFKVHFTATKIFLHSNTSNMLCWFLKSPSKIKGIIVNMNKIKDILDLNTYFWVPIVCFGVFLLIGAAIGLYKGWKKALYFLVWDIAALVLGVFATKPLLELIMKNVSIEADMKALLLEHKALLPVIMISWFVALKPIATLVEIPFRKKLKVDPDFGWRPRWIGAGVSLVSALPVTILSANAFTLISGKNFFSPATDAMVYGATFGQYEGISEHVTDIKNTLEVGTDKELQTKLQSVFDGSADLAKMPAADKTKIQNFINGENFPILLKNASGDMKAKLDEVKTDPTKLDQVKDAGVDKLKMTQAKWDGIANILKNTHGWTQDQVDKIYNNLVDTK